MKKGDIVTKTDLYKNGFRDFGEFSGLEIFATKETGLLLAKVDDEEYVVHLVYDVPSRTPIEKRECGSQDC